MTSQPSVRTSAPDATQPLKRRGLLAAGVAFVAGLVAKLTEQPVSAGTDGDVVLGAINQIAGGVTEITCNATDYIFQTYGSNSAGSGFAATGNHEGVLGFTFGATGSGAGVRGQSAGGAGTSGVRAFSINGNGVLAESMNSYSILRRVAAGSNANTIAIYGLNTSSYTGGTPGAGGFGVYGLCANGHGLVGATAAAGGAAVVGATNGVVGAYAAAFYGPVIVGGNFTVVGGAKSAAVPHPDGTHRRLYCMESPESWFEDFGTGQLECGRAEIMIDPDFAALVRLDDYHVFLTDRGSQQVLSVACQTPAGFTVEANRTVAALTGLKDSDLNGPFSWRVVAKRKDIAGDRLETVTIPTEPILPPVPDIPPPTPPMPRHQP